ncbi:hypothetical protein WDW89_07115 [Deltaproteobacteria bacterium TL4]
MKAQYIKHRGFDDEHYKKMILEYLKTYHHCSRHDIDVLLLDKLPAILDNKQKNRKIGNLISSLRFEGKIKNEGSDKKPKWILYN